MHAFQTLPRLSELFHEELNGPTGPKVPLPIIKCRLPLTIINHLIRRLVQLDVIINLEHKLEISIRIIDM